MESRVTKGTAVFVCAAALVMMGACSSGEAGGEPAELAAGASGEAGQGGSHGGGTSTGGSQSHAGQGTADAAQGGERLEGGAAGAGNADAGGVANQSGSGGDGEIAGAPDAGAPNAGASNAGGSGGEDFVPCVDDGGAGSDACGITDPALLDALRLATRISTGPIPHCEMARLTELSAPHVASLAGAQCLTSLQTLALEPGSVTDVSPLASLHDLQTLDLWSNQVSNLTPLTGLSKLQDLNLNANPVADLSPLLELPALTKLGLMGVVSYGEVELDTATLAQLTQLEELDLSGNSIEDLEILSTLTKLKRLSLISNWFQDVSPLQALTQLQELVIGGNQLPDISPLNALTQLEKLDLTMTTDLTSISPLTALHKLTDLNLYFNSITSIDAAAQMPNLERLNISYTGVTSLEPLSGHSHLTYLNADMAQLTSLHGLEAESALSEVQVGSNSLTDASALAGLKQLTHVGLVGNQLQGKLSFVDMPALVTLDLDGNPLGVLPKLKGLSSLERLGITSDQIPSFTGLDPQQMPALSGLYTWQNPTSDLSALASFQQLLSLSVGGDCSGVTVTDLSPVAALTDLTTLYVQCTTDAALTDIADLKKIEMLALENIDGPSALAALAQYPKVWGLTLTGLDVTDLTPIAGWPALTSFQLSDCPGLDDLSPLLETSLTGSDAYVYLSIPQTVCSSQSDTLTMLHARVSNYSLNCTQ